MNREKLMHYRKLLENERRELQSTIQSFKDQGIHENMNDVTGELSAYDQHPADYGSQMFEREKDIGLFQSLENQLNLVDQALAKIEQGNYGTCEQCKKPISEARLNVLPYAQLCVECKREEEARAGVDEGLRKLSFRRSFRDDSDFVGFDGEDAWQAVARFGTANNPQDLLGEIDYFGDGYPDADDEQGIVEDLEDILRDR